MAKTVAEKLVSNFNSVIGGLLRVSNPNNTGRMDMLMSEIKSVDKVCNYMEDWHLANPTPTNKSSKDLFMETALTKFYGYASAKHKKGEEPMCRVWVNGKRTVTPTREPAPTDENNETEPKAEVPVGEISVKPVQPVTSNDFMSQLGQMLVNMVAETSTEQISSVVREQAIKDIKDYISKEYGVLPQTHIFKIGEVTHDIKGVVHEKLGDVLVATMMGKSVFMVGNAGTGKNVIAQQVAETLKLPFYFSNAVTQEYKITGFTDANGVYHETPFYKAWTNGGVFMLDELDASIPDVLVILNAALSNGYMDFPAPIGNVKMHKDFHCIAAGNTYGLGADYEYVGRNVLDAASLNRFIPIEIGYDPKIEEAMAKGDVELLAFAREYRKVAWKNGVKSICSYRNIANIADFATATEWDAAKILNYCLTSALTVDDMVMMKNNFTVHNKWTTAFSNVIEEKRKLVA